jgi:hypothetical protein
MSHAMHMLNALAENDHAFDAVQARPLADTHSVTHASHSSSCKE